MDLRARRASAAAVAVGLAYGAHAALPASVQSNASAAPAAAGTPIVLPARLVSARTVDYRGQVTVAGRLGRGGANVPLQLQYRDTPAGSWQGVASTRTDATGGYRLSTRLGHSGQVRVSVSPTAVQSLVLGSGPVGGSGLPAGTVVPASPALPVAVRAGIGVSAAHLSVLGTGTARVAGTVYPSRGGVAVDLQLREGRAWRTVARDRTGGRGRYRLSFSPQVGGSALARVRVGVDGPDVSSARRVGSVTVFHQAGASWYGPGGTTACGESLTAGTLGVANKTLPCGTIVTLRYGSRTVRVPVIDRGPYVAGRDFDLTVATKQALGFGDVGDVWADA
jgi:hypothetical protein